MYSFSKLGSGIKGICSWWWKHFSQFKLKTSTNRSTVATQQLLITISIITVLAQSSLLVPYSAYINPAFSRLCSAQADVSISNTLVTSLSSVSTHTGKHGNFHLPTNITFLNDSPTVLQAVLLSVLSEQTAEQRIVNQFLTKLSLSSSDLICHNNSCQ